MGKPTGRRSEWANRRIAVRKDGAYRSLFTIHHSPFVIRYSLFAIRYSSPCSLPHFNHIINHARRNIDAGRIDAIAELHIVIDFVDQQAAVPAFQ